jgi:hypothetical protein
MIIASLFRSSLTILRITEASLPLEVGAILEVSLKPCMVQTVLESGQSVVFGSLSFLQ